MNSIRYLFLFFAACLVVVAPSADEGAGAIDLRALVEDLTLQEKIGQLSLRGRGSSGSDAPLSAELISTVRAS